MANAQQIPQASHETDAAISWIRGMAGLPLLEDVIEDDDTRREGDYKICSTWCRWCNCTLELPFAFGN